jgi:hypothetical protein
LKTPSPSRELSIVLATASSGSIGSGNGKASPVKNCWSTPYKEQKKEKKVFNMWDLCEITQTKEDTVAFLQEHGMLRKSRVCEAGHPMALVYGDDIRWRCQKKVGGKKCNEKLSIKTGTFFSQSNLNLKQLTTIMGKCQTVLLKINWG